LLKAFEDISSTKKRLKIEIPADAIEAEIKKGLGEAQKRARIPGFRPGKAPMNIIEKKFGKEIEADVLEKMVPEYYLRAVKEADIFPVSRPVAEETFDFKRTEPLSMTVTVDVRPRVENLNYENITVKEAPVEVKNEEIEAVLKNIAEEKAAYESSDEPIIAEDLVTIDYTAKKDGTAVKDAVLKIGSGSYPKEFFDGLAGKKRDEEFEMEAAFPEDSDSPFAGKKPKLEVKIKEVKRRNVPAIDDEFAKDLSFESLEALKTQIKENILLSKNKSADISKQKEILDKLLETHALDVPESLLNAEIANAIGQIRAAGKDNRSDEELTAEIRPGAEKGVKASILLQLIGEKENINVSDEDMKEEILTMAQRYYTNPENVMKYYVARDGSLDGLKQTVFEKKVLNFLLDKAIKEPTIEKGEQA
jgi:trigger factor